VVVQSILRFHRDRVFLPYGVAAYSQRDTIELHKVDACWYAEEGAEIELEALMPIAGTDVSQFCAGV
jgi:hypothetical protein